MNTKWQPNRALLCQSERKCSEPSSVAERIGSSGSRSHAYPAGALVKV